jgi:hypothetical protein
MLIFSWAAAVNIVLLMLLINFPSMSWSFGSMSSINNMPSKVDKRTNCFGGKPVMHEISAL